VENIDSLFKVAKGRSIPVFVSPHYYYPHDHGWQFEGALEKLMHNIGMFDRKDALSTDSFEGSGADWLERYKPYTNDGRTHGSQSAQGLRVGDQRHDPATA
jgi:hypothetical protein